MSLFKILLPLTNLSRSPITLQEGDFKIGKKTKTWLEVNHISQKYIIYAPTMRTFIKQAFQEE